jgi:hypothetical protein
MRNIGQTTLIALFVGVALPQCPGAAPSFQPALPDAGLIAAVDSLATRLEEGVVVGDFEEWYPGVYPGYGWARETTEIASNGLFQVDYVLLDAEKERVLPETAMSILLFRPGSPPGSASRGLAQPRCGAPWHAAARGWHAPAGEQRARLALMALEEALLAAEFYTANRAYYEFRGDSESMTLVSRLPASSPGTDGPGEPALRRVNVYLEPGKHGLSELVLEHAPYLLAIGEGQRAACRITLATEVRLFQLQYWDLQTGNWVDEWNETTNGLPKQVRLTLGLGGVGRAPRLAHTLASRIVALPATPVAPDVQGILSPVGEPPGLTNIPPGWPGFQPGVTNQPGIGQPGMIQPGIPNRPGLPQRRRQEPGASLEIEATGDARVDLEEASPASIAKSSRLAAVPQFCADYPLPFGGPRKALPAWSSDPMRDMEMEWLARSGIELARYILAAESQGPWGPVDCLLKRWAGGPGDANSVVAQIPMDNFPISGGSFSLRIVDADRKFNINVANDVIIRQALTLIGVPPAEQSPIIDSILDWRDADDAPRLNGAESDYYRVLQPPYFAKNGPIDDLSELLFVNGVTAPMYWGTAAADYLSTLKHPRARRDHAEDVTYAAGLLDLFTALSSPQININTASATVLQLIPEIDENIAHAIISGPGGRAGPDGVEGTADDMPFRSVQELARIPGFGNPAIVGQISRFFNVRSLVFEVHVLVRLGAGQREYVGLLRRTSAGDIEVLNLHWK